MWFITRLILTNSNWKPPWCRWNSCSLLMSQSPHRTVSIKGSMSLLWNRKNVRFSDFHMQSCVENVNTSILKISKENTSGKFITNFQNQKNSQIMAATTIFRRLLFPALNVKKTLGHTVLLPPKNLICVTNQFCQFTSGTGSFAKKVNLWSKKLLKKRNQEENLLQITIVLPDLVSQPDQISSYPKTFLITFAILRL